MLPVVFTCFWLLFFLVAVLVYFLSNKFIELNARGDDPDFSNLKWSCS